MKAALIEAEVKRQAKAGPPSQEEFVEAQRRQAELVRIVQSTRQASYQEGVMAGVVLFSVIGATYWLGSMIWNWARGPGTASVK